MDSFSTLGRLLKKWYLENHRPLPWRADRDPYKIWISEVMLQQTTVTAVVPFYERFLKRFPNIKILAEAQQEEVLKYWSGLGYYSRARNLHKAAQQLHLTGFPKTFQDLLKLPGFGPYTARAVSSLAFNEVVGVLDGNVIRVLSRVLNKSIKWWTTSGRLELQNDSDLFVQNFDPSIINQALMELGATLCTPKSPHCHRCPWSKHCRALQKEIVDQLPLAKPRKKIEFWVWKPQVRLHNSTIELIKNHKIPFLKGHYIFEGEAHQMNTPPKQYDLTHTITHHKIYVQIQKKNLSKKKKHILTSNEGIQVPLSKVKEVSPSSLIQKILEAL